MLWFRYRWILTSSHGLCVKIIRGSEAVKILILEVDSLFARPINLVVLKAILNRILRLINILDDIIFSASALLYREEKGLIKFSKRVEEAVKRLVVRLMRDKARYERDAMKLERIMKELKEKKQRLPRGFEANVQKEKRNVTEEEERKNEVVALLNNITSFIEELDGKIHDTNLEAKAQKRKTFNTYMLKENIIIRSNYRLGKVTKKRGIEASALIKRIRNKLEYFSKIVGKNRKLDINQVSELLKYCRIEAQDLENIFLFIIQLSERIESRLYRVRGMILKDVKLRPLSGEYNQTKGRLDILRKDIEKQQRRLDNEFKKGGFMPNAQIQREIRAAN